MSAAEQNLADASAAVRLASLVLLTARCGGSMEWPGKARALLDDDDPAVRAAAAISFAWLPKATRMDAADVLRAMSSKDADARVRRAAAVGFARLNGDSRPTPEVISALSDPDPRLRDLAIATLADMAFRGAPVTGALVDTTRDGTLAVRRAAVGALESTVSDATEVPAAAAVLAALDALRDRDPAVCRAAARSMAFLAIPDWLTRRSRSVGVTPEAKALPPITPAEVLALRRALEQRDPVVAADACMGDEGLERLPVNVRRAALLALGRPEGAPAVSQVARPPRPRLARARGRVDALGRMGAPALDALRAALADRDLQTQGAAARALQRMGPAARPAIPALAATLARGNPELARDAALALGAVGAAAVPTLVKALSTRKPVVRRAAVEGLTAAGPAAATSGPALLRALSDEDPAVRRAAAAAIDGLGPSGQAALRAAMPSQASRHDEGSSTMDAAAVGALLDSLETVEPRARPAVAHQLRRQLLASHVLFDRLASPDATARRRACEAAVAIILIDPEFLGKGGLLEQFAALQSDPDAGVREAAAAAWRAFMAGRESP